MAANQIKGVDVSAVLGIKVNKWCVKDAAEHRRCERQTLLSALKAAFNIHGKLLAVMEYSLFQIRVCILQNIRIKSF